MEFARATRSGMRFSGIEFEAPEPGPNQARTGVVNYSRQAFVKRRAYLPDNRSSTRS